MEGRAHALLGLGGVALLESVAMGAPWTGYGRGLAPLLFRVGIVYVVLAAVTARPSPVTVRQAVGGAVGALVVVFLAGSGTIYYDLVVTLPAVGTPTTVTGLVTTQAVLTLVLVPVSAGYVCGVVLRRGRVARSLALFGGAVVGGWLVPSVITFAGGTQSEFAALYYVLVSLGSGVAGLPVLALVRRQTGSRGPTVTDQPAP
ncbi:MAG: hypothetical protein ABEJ43_09465 [Haloferacaceae archaeon]